MYKHVAKKARVHDWNSCTGHALLALCITWCICQGLAAADVAAKVRHASIKSSPTCAMEQNKRKANCMTVMNPEGNDRKKKAKKS